MTSWRAALDRLEESLEAYEKQVIAHEKELQLLRKIDVEIMKSSTELDSIFKLIADGACELTSADIAGLLRYHDAKNLKLVASSPGSRLGDHLIPIKNSVTGRVYQTGELENLPNCLKDPEYYKIAEGMKSELAVPLIDTSGDRDMIMGVLNLEALSPGHFTAHHEQLVGALAGQAAIGIRNAHLHQELITMLQMQTEILAKSGVLRESLKMIGQRSLDLIGAEECQVLRTEDSELIIEFTTGPEPPGTRVRIADSISGLAVDTEQPVNIEDIKTDPRAKNRYQAVLHNMRSELAIPIIGPNEERLGVINLESPRVGAFREHDEQLLSLFAGLAAMEISGAKRVEELLVHRQTNAQLWGMVHIADIAGNLVHRVNSDVGAIGAITAEIQAKCGALLEENSFLAERLREIASKTEETLKIPRRFKVEIEKVERYKKISPNEIIKKLADEFRQSLKSSGITINTDHLDPSTPQIHTYLQFENVIQNLLKNAIEALGKTRHGGIVSLQTKPWENPYLNEEKKHLIGAEILVSDTGPGIPTDIQQSVFEVGVSRKKGGRGMGFGLWWVKKFLDRVGGEISCKTQAGEGTTFTIRMPLKSRRC